jgi:NAD(P)-dependent dehydrogenase (short-subunit alcohol dehydrogenase family)
MDGTRVLVVGASSGIGRATGIRAVRHGASVAFAARRADKLGEAVAEAGGGVVLEADVRDEADCARLVADAVAALGGLDLVLYATGTSPLRRLRDTGLAEWEEVLETNLVGAHLVARAAAPHLGSHGLYVAISSDSVAQPRPGLVPYAASKAALEALLAGLRAEYPGQRFGCLAVGPTMPTGFGDQFDPGLIGELFDTWMKQGLTLAAMHTDEVAEVIVETAEVLLRNPGIGLDYMLIRPVEPVAS